LARKGEIGRNISTNHGKTEVMKVGWQLVLPVITITKKRRFT